MEKRNDARCTRIHYSEDVKELIRERKKRDWLAFKAMSNAFLIGFQNGADFSVEAFDIIMKAQENEHKDKQPD